MEVEQEADVSRAAFRPMSELVVRLPQGRDFPTAPGRVPAPGLGTRTRHQDGSRPDQVAAAMPGLG